MQLQVVKRPACRLSPVCNRRRRCRFLVHGRRFATHFEARVVGTTPAITPRSGFRGFGGSEGIVATQNPQPRTAPAARTPRHPVLPHRANAGTVEELQQSQDVQGERAATRVFVRGSRKRRSRDQGTRQRILMEIRPRVPAERRAWTTQRRLRAAGEGLKADSRRSTPRAKHAALWRPAGPLTPRAAQPPQRARPGCAVPPHRRPAPPRARP